MPGLVCIVSRHSPDQCRKQLKDMLCATKHESFYSSGTYESADMGLYVGWTCHEHAANDCLPMVSENKDFILFLSGEVFPEPGTRNSIVSGGHRVLDSGLSYLVHMYEEQGQHLFTELNGWFVGILVDRRQDRCFIFNDRFGMERLFTHGARDRLYFASEAKALLQVAPETRSLNPDGVAELLTCGCVLGNKTLYTGIEVMPPASVWTIAGGALVGKGIYFTPSEWILQEPLNQARFTELVVESFPQIARKYARSEVPVGISVTGGLDSRILMACLEMSPGEFPCYTFGSMFRDTFDVTAGRRVAKTCEQRHAVIVLGREFLKDFPSYLEEAVYRSDGYLGFSGAAELYVNAQARRIAPVRLTGNWGGELLRGARAFKSVLPQPGFFVAAMEPYLSRAEQTFHRLEANDPISFAVFCQAPNQGYGRLAIERSQVNLRTPFMDNELVKLVYQRPAAIVDGRRLSISIVKHHRPELMGIPTDRGDLGNGGLLQTKLRTVYQVALAKAEYLADDGMPQWAAAMSRHLPLLPPAGKLLGMNKFQHFGIWSRQELSQYVRDVLLSHSSLSEFLDRRHLASSINNHMQGRRNFIREIDLALTIALCETIMLRRAPVAYREEASQLKM